VIPSSDLSQVPHTEVYDGQPYMGGLFYGPGGLMCICHVGPATCLGLLIDAHYKGVAEFTIDDFSKLFTHRAMVAESLAPEARLQ
jgi:hypothetical protein